MDKKRLVAYVLAATLATGYVAPVAYASENTKVLSQQEKIQVLEDKNILLGKKFNKDSSDSLSLTDEITRSEITKLLVYTIGREELAKTLDGVTKPFPDVELGHWANGFISAAATTDIQKGQYRLVIGDENGMFMPEQQITYGELATTLLRAVRPNLNETGMIYPKDYVEAAEREGIFKGISKVTVNKPVVRSEAFEMVYNAYVKLGTVPKTYTDNIGIVRKVSGWGILANQTIRFDDDNSTSYRVSDEFKVTSGAQWDKVARNQVDDVVKYGILTKYVLDEDNRVSHLVELGNDLNGVISKDRFNTLFKIISNGTAFETNDYEGTNDNVSVFNSYKITGDGLRLELVNNNSSSNTEVELTENTKVYILQGDKVYNLRTENDKKNNLPKLDPSKTRVYGAFENENNRNNAIVLVFSGKVEKSESDLYKDAENAIDAYRKDNSSKNRQAAENSLKKLADSNEKTRLQDILNEEINIDNAKIALSKFKQTPTSFNKEAAKTAIEKIISSNIKNELFRELDSISVNDSISKTNAEKIAEIKKLLEEFRKDYTNLEKRNKAVKAINDLEQIEEKNALIIEFNEIDKLYKSSENTSNEEKLKQYQVALNAINGYKFIRSEENRIKAQDEINKLPESSTYRTEAQDELDRVLAQIKLYDEAYRLIGEYGKDLVYDEKVKAMNNAKSAIDKITDEYLKEEALKLFNEVQKPISEVDVRLDQLRDSINNDSETYVDNENKRTEFINRIEEIKKITDENEKSKKHSELSDEVNNYILEQYKEKYSKEIEELTHLTEDEKSKFISDLNDSIDIESAYNIVKGAFDTDKEDTNSEVRNPGKIADKTLPEMKIPERNINDELKKPFSLTETLLQLVK